MGLIPSFGGKPGYFYFTKGIRLFFVGRMRTGRDSGMSVVGFNRKETESDENVVVQFIYTTDSGNARCVAAIFITSYMRRRLEDEDQY